MFARFRNLFSKNKGHSELETSEVETSVTSENGTSDIETSEVVVAPVKSAGTKEVNDSVKPNSELEGLSYLKSLVETEQKSLNNEAAIGSIPEVATSIDASLSQEVANMLKNKLINFNENLETKQEVNGIHEELNEKKISAEMQESSLLQNLPENISANPKETESEPIDLLNTDKEICLNQLKSEENLESLNESSEIFNNYQENDVEKTKLESSVEVLEKTCENSNLNTEFTNNKDKEINFDNNKVSSSDTTAEISYKSPETSVTDTTNNDNLNNADQEAALAVKKPDNINDSSPLSSEIDQNNLESFIENLQESLEDDLNKENDSVKEILQELITEVSKQVPEEPQDFKNSHENSPEFSESSHSSSLTSVKDNNANSTTYYPSTDSDSNLYTNSSIVVDDLPSEVNTPSPTVDSTISGSSSSNTSTLDSSALSESSDPTKIIVNPINSNILACNAITSKLSDIAEVAESLDTVIRNIQENSQAVEVESNPSPSDKKLGTLRSTSSEDWHSRSTEDDSFATASEGNFTPHSHSSSSFQTASGRTSSYISCDKNSFDASEADDSTYAFEMPELTSPLNMSFEGSEQSYISAQPLDVDQTTQDNEQTPTRLSESGSQTFNQLEAEEDQSSIADVEELHSESVTPTPQDDQDYHVDSIPVESETELEVAGISDAPSMEILTETRTMPMSRTPEVSSSPSTSAACTNQQMLNNTGDVDDDDATTAPSNEQNTNKPNAAWRRSKYYENITKQTIKGFL